VYLFTSDQLPVQLNLISQSMKRLIHDVNTGSKLSSSHMITLLYCMTTKEHILNLNTLTITKLPGHWNHGKTKGTYSGPFVFYQLFKYDFKIATS